MIVRNLLLLPLLAVLLLSRPAPALAGKRVALVIGNGRYESSPLRNPVNDAQDVAAALKGLGFTVILRTDADRRGMVEAVRDFGQEAKGAEASLFFYAGHGMQVNGRNYLFPVGASVGSESEVEFEALDVDRAMAAMKDAGSGVNIVILDACRDNPFRGFRSSSRGLAAIQNLSGSVVVYATSPNSVAADGSGRNSPFTAHLLAHIGVPGLRVEEVFKRVGQGVSQDTGSRQVPWISSSLFGDFYLAGSGPAAPSGPDLEARRQEMETERQRIEAAQARLASERAKLEEERRQEAERMRLAREQAALEEKKRLEAEQERLAQGQATMEEQRKLEAEQARLASERAKLEEQRKLEAERVRLAREQAALEEKKRLEAEQERLASERVKLEEERRKLEEQRKALPPAQAAKDSGPASSVPAGKVWTDPVSGMELVWVEGGCFQMGSEWGRNDGKPVHGVCVDGFWMGRFEVTQGQWVKMMWSNPSAFRRGDSYPVENVSWDEAQEFVRKLTGQGKGIFRLPTEAEWEFAARSGGRDEAFPGGNDVDNVAWFDENSGKVSHQVGTKAPNGLGLYDMGGNVWEWCEDWYDKDAYASHPRDNPKSTNRISGSRVLRGGSWNNVSSFARCAYRDRRFPDYRSFCIGFRVVRLPQE